MTISLPSCVRQNVDMLKSSWSMSTFTEGSVKHSWKLPLLALNVSTSFPSHATRPLPSPVNAIVVVGW